MFWQLKFWNNAKLYCIISQGRYRMADTQSTSTVAIKWLLWIEHSEGVQNAGNTREVRLREENLLGDFCAKKNTVYQFHGCHFHGEKCYPDQTVVLFLKSNPQATEFANLRDNFQGGRLNAVKLYHKAKQGEHTLWTFALYNKYGKYPVGHPKIHVGHDECCRLDINTVEGIISVQFYLLQICTILFCVIERTES